MREGTSSKLVFSRLKRQKVEGYFDGGRLTSDAGAMLLREVDRRLGLTSALAACITDPRCVRRIRHDRHRMLTQRVFGIGLGYEDLNDHQSLRDEPLFQVLVAQRPDPDRPLASPATLCRFENRIKEQQLGLFADRTRCHKFLANPFRLLLASAAYELLEASATRGPEGYATGPSPGRYPSRQVAEGRDSRHGFGTSCGPAPVQLLSLPAALHSRRGTAGAHLTRGQLESVAGERGSSALNRPRPIAKPQTVRDHPKTRSS